MVELRIKEILKERDMTVKSLADSMGKTPQYVGNVINGGKGASLNKLQEIADALEVPVSSLFADYKRTSQTIICPKCGTKMTFTIEE